MTRTLRQGAVGALLDEYERAIADLRQTIADISENELIADVDKATTDPNCRSVQTILAHVVKAGFAYAIDIRKLSGEKLRYPDILIRPTVTDYDKDLSGLFKFTEDTFTNIRDDQLEESDNNKKIITSWGQVYDIEQITEHAIVHVLRHRRQIERFKIILRGKK